MTTRLCCHVAISVGLQAQGPAAPARRLSAQALCRHVASSPLQEGKRRPFWRWPLGSPLCASHVQCCGLDPCQEEWHGAMCLTRGAQQCCQGHTPPRAAAARPCMADEACARISDWAHPRSRVGSEGISRGISRGISTSISRNRASSSRRGLPPCSPPPHAVPPQLPDATTENEEHNASLASNGSDSSSGGSNDGTTRAAGTNLCTTEYERLFSNLNQATLEHEPGSLTSAILLVAGTTVGAGILAIPAVTQESGFLASAVTCVICWAYMVTTGLLLAEVNVNTMCELGSGGVSLVSMAERTLGKVGVQASCVTYVLIHYALLVAYVARSSDIIADATGLPQWASAVVFSLPLGGLCYWGSQRVIGAVNGALVVGVISSFLFLLLVASSGLSLEPLLRADFSALPASVPIIALSFVYQNVVPVVATNMEGDLGRIRTAIVAGTAIPLVMFLAWNAVILGSLPVPVDGSAGAAIAADNFEGLELVDPLAKLQEMGGTVGASVQVFSFFAIATSYIGFVLGLTDFLADWLRLPASRTQVTPVGPTWQVVPAALTVLPPIALALLNPDIFFRALDVAGTYGVLVLFGIIPASMAWSERYSSEVAPPVTKPLVPGGRPSLILVFAGAGIIITNEIITSFFR